MAVGSGHTPSQRELADVLEAIGDAVYAIDRHEHILFANRRALELWGRGADEVVGRRLLDAFPGIADGEPYRAYRRVLRSRKPLHLETVAPAMAGRWIGLDVHPAQGGGLVVVFRDIDDRKRAEAALRDSEDRFRSMLEALPQLAFVIGPDGNATYYNRQFRDYAGDPIGPAAADRNAQVHPEDRPRLIETRNAGVAAGIEYTTELRLRRHDGVYRWHRINNRPVHAEGRVAYWLGTAVDIDDMREANTLLEERVAARTAELAAANRRLADQIEEREKAEAKLRQSQRIEAIGQLTAGIAHDFNNLMTAIIGNIELVTGRLADADERVVRLLSAALAAAERGANLTTQLLAFSRQQRMSREWVDLNRVVTSIGPLISSSIGGTIRIVTAPLKGLWPVLADTAQIELVLLNLAINARDATPAGGTITIATGNVTLGPPRRPEEPPAGDYAMVSIADTGSGIPPDILDKVFDPFFTTKEVGRGSGLGLSQVLGVAQQLGGGVSIAARPEGGTVVSVYVPRLRETTAASSRPAPRRRAAAGDTGARHGTILLVDDDDDVRAVAATMLREAGHSVVEAASGSAALECLADEGGRIELLIADLAMPGMSGFELARVVRDTRPHLPILFVTGYADRAARLDGFDAHRLLLKPFRAAELTARVADALAHGAAADQATPA